jgi:hypothetical protein
MFSGIKRWDLVVMFCLMGALTVFEMLGVFSPRLITITQILKALVPMPVRIMVLAWLCWHFCFSDIIRAIQTGTPIK